MRKKKFTQLSFHLFKLFLSVVLSILDILRSVCKLYFPVSIGSSRKLKMHEMSIFMFYILLCQLVFISLALKVVLWYCEISKAIFHIIFN
jgi:hypothetical protein